LPRQQHQLLRLRVRLLQEQPTSRSPLHPAGSEAGRFNLLSLAVAESMRSQRTTMMMQIVVWAVRRRSASVTALRQLLWTLAAGS